MVISISDKGLSAGEKRMLSQARNILTSELSYALDLDREQADDTLNRVLRLEDVSDIIATKKKNARAEKKVKAEKAAAKAAKSSVKAKTKPAAKKATTTTKKAVAKKATNK